MLHRLPTKLNSPVPIGPRAAAFPLFLLAKRNRGETFSSILDDPKLRFLAANFTSIYLFFKVIGSLSSCENGTVVFNIP